MEEKSGVRARWRVLMFMPSFYGLLTFPFFYFLYIINVFPYEEKNFNAQLVCIAVIVFFLSSILFHFGFYSRLLDDRFKNEKDSLRNYSHFTHLLLWMFFLIGLLGSFKYILDFSGYFGGLWLFFFLLFNDSAQIRIAQDFQTSIGFQLSYFAWIAATMFVLKVRLKIYSKIYLVFALLIFLLNLFFIDRTRPLTILFTTLLVLFFVFFDRFTTKRLRNIFLFTGLTFVSVFVILGEWIGKVAQDGEYGATFIPPVFQTAVLYGSSSFGYFNRMVEENEAGDFIPSRSLYPAQKFLSSLRIAEEPPPQINEFYFIPQPTNVGTFLEPLYRDGGLLYCFLGIFLHSFLFELAGIFFIRNLTSFSLYGLAILCFINFFAFFSPKFNSLPMWIFIALAFVSCMYVKFKRAANPSESI